MKKYSKKDFGKYPKKFSKKSLLVAPSFVFGMFLGLVGILSSVSSYAGSAPAPSSVAKQRPMSDQQSMKCIYSDKVTQSAFQDLQAAYGLRLIEAKDFFQTMDKAKNCAELKKSLQKLRQTTVARFPSAPMRAPTPGASSSGSGSASASTSSAAPYISGSGTTGGSFGGNVAPVPYEPPFPGDYYGPPGDSYGFPADDMDF